MAMAYKYKVFISYRRENAVFMDTVYDILKEYIEEKEIFVDKERLYDEPNKWPESLDKALNDSEYIIICVNKYSFIRKPEDGKTDWYYKEIFTALEREKNEHKNRIILAVELRFDFKGTDFEALSNVQDVNYQSLGKEKFREKLLQIVGIEINSAQKIPYADPVIYNVPLPENLISRPDMLANVGKSFRNRNCVLISGIGGSGKTSLAYLYAKLEHFNNIAWITVNGDSIENDFLATIGKELIKDDDEYEKFKQNPDASRKRAKIKDLLMSIHDKNLLVFDINTNNEKIKQEIERKIHEYLPGTNWKTLILTRTTANNPKRFDTIPMDKMTEFEAIELFKINIQRDIEFSDVQLAEIAKELYYHPLLIEQTALYFNGGFETTAEEIITKIKDNKIRNERTKEYLSGLAAEGKDDQDIYTYLLNLCNIDNLSAEEICFLAIYVTWPAEPVDKEIIDTLLPGTEATLKTLIKKGIISRYGNQCVIHNLIADVLREQIKEEGKKLNAQNANIYTPYFNNIKNLLINDEKSFVIHKYSKWIASSFFNYGICEEVDIFRNFLIQLSTVNDPILFNLPEPEYTKAITKMEGKADKYQLALLYNAEARVEYFINNLKDAKKHYEKALEIINTLEENEKNLTQKGTFLNNLAMLEADINDYQSANKHYNEGLNIDRKLTKSSYKLNNIAATLNNIAIFEEENLRNLSLSLKHKQEALEIRRQLPKTPENLNELAKLLNNYASLDRKLNDFDSALNHLEEALKIINELPETPANANLKATILAGLGVINTTVGKIDAAQTNYETAVEIREKLPKTQDNLVNLANIYTALGYLERSRRNINPAQLYFNKAKKIYLQFNIKIDACFLEYALQHL